MGDFVNLPSKKKLKEAFDDLCKKGSKKLNLEQFKKLCYKFYLSPTNNGIAQLFQEMDKNNDDLLSFDEVEALIKKQWTPINERKEAFLEDLRKARSGKGPITRAELKTILQNGSDEALTDEDVNYCFDKMDINKDNQISEEELIELIFKIEEVLSRAPSRIKASTDETGQRSRSSSSSSDDSSNDDKKHKSRSRSNSPKHNKKDRNPQALSREGSTSSDIDKNSDLFNNKRNGSGKQTNDGRIRNISNGQSGNIDELVKVEPKVELKYPIEVVNQKIEADQIKFENEESEDEIEMENDNNDEEQDDVLKDNNENKNKNINKFNSTNTYEEEQEANKDTEEDNENEDEQEDNENEDEQEDNEIAEGKEDNENVEEKEYCADEGEEEDDEEEANESTDLASGLQINFSVNLQANNLF